MEAQQPEFNPRPHMWWDSPSLDQETLKLPWVGTLVSTMVQDGPESRFPLLSLLVLLPLVSL